MPANPISVFECAGLSRADAALAACAQGLINRETPQLFLRWSKETGKIHHMTAGQLAEGAEDRWLDFLASRYGLTYTTIDSLENIAELAKPFAKGIVVWDQDIPDTRNVANTIAGVEELLIANETQLPMLKKLGYAIVHDLRGQFLGKTRAEIYRWAYDQYFAQCDGKTLLCRSVEQTFTFDVTKLLEADNTLRVRVAPLRSESYDIGCDIKFARLRSTNGKVLDEVDRHDVAQGFSVMGDQSDREGADLSDVLKPVELTLTATPEETTYLVIHPIGWFTIEVASGEGEYQEIYKRPQHPGYGQREGYTVHFDPFMRDLAVARRHFCIDLNSVTTVPDEYELNAELQKAISPNGMNNGWHTELSSEWDYLVLASRHGNIVNASLSAHNLSLMQHLGKGEPRIKPTPPAPKIDPDKIYLSFVVADGDALGIVYHFQRGMFFEQSRGSIPLGWSLNAVQADYAPPMLQYYIDNATDQDCIFAASSGAGYCYPDQMPEDLHKLHAKWSVEFMNRTGFPGMMFYGTPPHKDVKAFDADEDYIRVWADAAKLGDGSFIGAEDGYWSYQPLQHKVVDGFSWARTTLPDASVWGDVEPENMIESIKKLPERKKEGEPLFVPMHPWIDRQIGPNMVADWIKQLGSEFEVVRRDHMLMMIRDWKEQPE